MRKRNYNELLKRYMLIFDESFPTMIAPGTEEDHMDIIEKCLEEQRPYDPYANGDAIPDAVY